MRRPSQFSHFRSFGVLVFPRISHFRMFHIFAHFTYTAHFVFHIFRAFHVLTSFTHFTFQIPRVFTHLTNYAHLAIPHSLQFTHSHISQVSHSHAFRVFCILAFFAFQHVLLRASLGSIAFCSHVLFSSSKVHWCVSHLVSLALYHICPCIHIYVCLSHYVFILHHPCMFSATYLAPRPGNSLSMLIRQRIVRVFFTLLLFHHLDN
jgi:hypothetical protein